MKLQTLIKGDTAAKLERAEEDLAATDAAIASAQQERLAKLLDGTADDIAELDRKIIDQHRVAAVYRERIAGLQSRLATEQTAEREKRRQQAIKVVEAMLPARAQIVAEIEAAIKALPSLFSKLSSWRDKFVKQYPIADVEFPYAHSIDSDRVLRIVIDALRNIRAEDFHERIDGLAASEAEQHAALVADLKANAPDVSTDTNSEAA
jgi:hypothetical protein